MPKAVLKGASYILVHTPDMIYNNGTTTQTELKTNPDSEFLKEVKKHFRSYEDVVSYPPNQAYIGNLFPDELAAYAQPWYDKKVEGASRYGKFGEIQPQLEFIAMMKAVDTFDLVQLNKEFTAKAKEAIAADPIFTEADVNALKEGEDSEVIEKLVSEEHSEPIEHEGKLVGCVKRAHDVDPNLTAHVMFENLVVKASGVLAARHLVKVTGIDPASIEYVIECYEEAC